VGEAGVVERRAEAAELVRPPAARLVDRRPAAAAAPDGQPPPALGAHRPGDALGRRAAAPARHDVSSDLRQLDGDRAADALAGARHDGDAVAKRVRREAHDAPTGRSVAFAKRARRITTGNWRARSRVVIERREAPGARAPARSPERPARRRSRAATRTAPARSSARSRRA